MASDRIPVDKDWRNIVVVKDVRAMARNYAEVFGIDKWQIVDHSADRLTNVTKDGRAPVVPPSFIMALGETEQIHFTLVQPTGGESYFSEFLATHGEGIAGIHTAMVQKSDIKGLIDFLAGEGVGIGMSGTLDDAISFYSFDTRKALGGFQVMVLVPEVEDVFSKIKVDEVLDYSGETFRPSGRGPFDTPGNSHFGVVVFDLMESLQNYHRLFKVPQWRGMNWRTEPGWLEGPTYYGKPVDHAYFTGSAGVGDTGMAFEVIQPTFGPSHYKEDFRSIVGEGIHHMNLKPFKVIDEYQSVEKWFKGMGIDMVMSGGLRYGVADFWYMDTRQKLGGYVAEMTCPRPVQGERRRFDPDWQYDFSVIAEVKV